jgi:uncharacterized protein
MKHMRLLLPTLILFCYVLVSLVWPIPCRPVVKVLAIAVLLCITLKYTIYETLGHSFIAPEFPTWLLLIMEVLFSTLVILVFLLVMKDLLALGLWLSRFFGGDLHLPFTTGIRGAGLVGAAFFLALYGTRQAMRVPDVHTVEMVLPRLPAELDGFSIVQLSDIHIGLLLKGKWLQEVVNRTNTLAADIVVLTGDMIDGTPEAIKDDMVPLRDLQARHGVYGITGNHEYYFNVHKWLPAFRELGIEILQNESRTFHMQGKNLVLAGVPDLAATHYQETGPDLQSLQDSTPEGVRVLLQHRPSGVSEGFQPDLQLSGHTHGGNLFFIKWLIAAFNGGLVGGLFDLGQMKLYVSPGTGIWAGFSCRLGIPSEITRIILRSPAARKI